MSSQKQRTPAAKKGAQLAAKAQAQRSISKTTRAGTTVSVSRVIRYLKQRGYTKRLGVSAAVAVAAYLHYILEEILDTAVRLTRAEGRTRLTPLALLTAIRNDEELNGLLGQGVGPVPGVIPNLEEEKALKAARERAREVAAERKAAKEAGAAATS